MKKRLALLLACLLCALHAYALADALPEEIRNGIAEYEMGTILQYITVADASRNSMVLLTQRGEDAYQVSVFCDYGTEYGLDEESAPLPALHGVAPSLSPVSRGFILRYEGEADYYFHELRRGEWKLTRVEGTDPAQAYDCNAWLLRSDSRQKAVYAHESTAYLRHFQPEDFPASFSEAVAIKDSSDCALVCNPNPDDRLHLRAEPDTAAISKGRFYNATPVKILGITGEWAHVQLDEHNEGYMMRKYLAIGAEEMLQTDWFSSAYTLNTEDPVTIYSRPDETTVVRGKVSGDGVNVSRVVGYINENWFYVEFDSDDCGYVRAENYIEGNG